MQIYNRTECDMFLFFFWIDFISLSLEMYSRYDFQPFREPAFLASSRTPKTAGKEPKL